MNYRPYISQPRKPSRKALRKRGASVARKARATTQSRDSRARAAAADGDMSAAPPPRCHCGAMKLTDATWTKHGRLSCPEQP